MLEGRSTFRLVLTDPLEADAYHLEDEAGKFQVLFVQVEQATLSTAEIPFVDGLSGAAYTRAGEHTAVLLKAGAVVRRVRVALPLGGVHEVEL